MIPFRTTVDASASPNITMALIVINIAVFIIQIGMTPQEEARFAYTHGLVPMFVFEPATAERLGIDYRPVLSLISNTFLHGGWLHLIINMWTLWLFGVPLEDRLGMWRFILLYLSCGFAGSLLHLLSNLSSTIPAVGASGAIAGLLGTFVWMFPRERVAIVVPIIVIPLVFHVPTLLFAIVWFALQIVPGLTSLSAPNEAGGIAWWAHIGGFGAGLAIAAGFRWKGARPPKTPLGPWSR